MKTGGLHQRRTRFVKEYLLDQNATRAALAAGYSRKTAYAQGSRLLKDAEIRKAVEEGNEKVNASLDLTAERIKQEIARLCYYDPAAFFNKDGTTKPLSELDEDARRAIAGFESAELFTGDGKERSAAGVVKKFKLADKGRALELAARCLKLLTDKVEINAGDELIRRLQEGRERARTA